MKEKGTVFIVIFEKVKQTPIAFASYQISTEVDNEENELDVLYCYEIQVEENWRGKGIGKYLMSELYDIACSTKMEKLMLTVQKENKQAIQFYLGSMGYSFFFLFVSFSFFFFLFFFFLFFFFLFIYIFQKRMEIDEISPSKHGLNESYEILSKVCKFD